MRRFFLLSQISISSTSRSSLFSPSPSVSLPPLAAPTPLAPPTPLTPPTRFLSSYVPTSLVPRPCSLLYHSPMPLCHRSRRFAALFLALGAASISPARAQDLGATAAQAILPASPARLDEVLASQNRFRSAAQVAVSPDGRRLAWLEAGEIRVAPLPISAKARSLPPPHPVSSAAPPDSSGRPTPPPSPSSPIAPIPAGKPIFISLISTAIPPVASRNSMATSMRRLSRRMEKALLFSASKTPRALPMRSPPRLRPPASSDKITSRFSVSQWSLPELPNPSFLPLSRLPIFTSSSSTGRPTPGRWPTSPPTLPAKTTGGSPNSTRNPSLRPAHLSVLRGGCPIHLDCGCPILSGRRVQRRAGRVGSEANPHPRPH